MKLMNARKMKMVIMHCELRLRDGEIKAIDSWENGYRMNQTLKSMKMKIRIHVLMRNWVDEAWKSKKSWYICARNFVSSVVKVKFMKTKNSIHVFKHEIEWIVNLESWENAPNFKLVDMDARNMRKWINGCTKKYWNIKTISCW